MIVARSMLLAIYAIAETLI